MTGARETLRLGMWSAWTLAGFYLAYIAALLAGGVAQGVPTDPYLALAEGLIILAAPLQVVLAAVVYQCAPQHARAATLVGLGWMMVMAGLTMTVHFVELTVARAVNTTAIPGFERLFGWEWPSLLYAIELMAWHMFLGLSLLFMAQAFPGRGTEVMVRVGLRTAGALCIAGLAGPLLGNLDWRMIGVFGYGAMFPAVCILMGTVFRSAARSAAD
jgi:hypothetical protein